ncbi:MAG TPA: alpha/beta hydrolase [Gammaproteobacteria bacterium]|nr:alpha/beta hydrolase [Gammaproteobacteria bacterium]
MPSIASRRARALLVLLGAPVFLAACAGAPPPLPGSLIEGAGFMHRIDVQGRLDGADRVHVYLEGDGRPFATRHLPAGDPTPRRRLARELMALDPAPSIYLARPCYEGLAQAPGCAPRLWTEARYGTEVVASLAAALARLRVTHRIGHYTLVGYSGGGVLAMLLAERIEAVDRVITVAANLDLEAWAAAHGYSPLTASLDPARRPPLPPRVAQVHYAGGRDRNVPPAQISAALRAQTGARLVIVDDAAHARGWITVWPLLLAAQVSGSVLR